MKAGTPEGSVVVPGELESVAKLVSNQVIQFNIKVVNSFNFDVSLALALIILQAWCRWATRRGWRGRWRCPSWSAPPFLSGPLRCRPRDDENSFNHQTVFQIFKMIWSLDNTCDPLCRMGASFLQRVGAKQRWRIFRQIIIFKKESKLHNILYTLYLQSNTLD